MNDPRNHLPRDLQALRYLDALNAGDLETVSALWEAASHDPELERVLTDLDAATVQEILGNSSVRPERLGQRSRWAVCGYAAGAVAAACLLAIFAWPQHDTKKPGSSPPQIQTGKDVAHQPPYVSHDLTPMLDARRDLNEAAMPRFVWPQENLLSASTPLNLLD